MAGDRQWFNRLTLVLCLVVKTGQFFILFFLVTQMSFGFAVFLLKYQPVFLDALLLLLSFNDI